MISGGNGDLQQQRSSNIRARLLDAIEKYHLKQVDIARETRVHHSTLSLWLQDKAKGHKASIEEAMEKFLQKLMSNRPRISSTHITKLHSLKSNKELDPQEGDPSVDSLVPIKLDIDLDGKQLKDSFIWDKQEPYLSLDYFAKILAEEHNLAQVFEPEIVTEMRKKLSMHKSFKPTPSGEDLRPIKLEVRINNIVLRDQFMWDINNTQNSPETFASSLVADLGLGSEFLLPISHNIREQLHKYRKSLHDEYRGSLSLYAPLSEVDPRTLFRSPSTLESNIVANSHGKESDPSRSLWSPTVQQLSEEEVSKYEKQEERLARYARRNRQQFF